MSELSDQLHCFGYYGFGGGYALRKWGPAGDTKELACARCDLKQACWKRHQDRTRELLPISTALSDQIVQEGFLGEGYMREFKKRTDDTPLDTNEPFITVMLSNIEDGGVVAEGGRPVAHERTGVRLTWPLKVLT